MDKEQTKKSNYPTAGQGPTTEKTIGGTTYIVTAHFSETARETAIEKIRRLILKDFENTQ